MSISTSLGAPMLYLVTNFNSNTQHFFTSLQGAIDYIENEADDEYDEDFSIVDLKAAKEIPFSLEEYSAVKVVLV